MRENGVISITCKTGEDADQTLEFDHMIIAFPQRLERLNALMQLSKQEQDVFGAVKYVNYASQLWKLVDNSELADGTKKITDSVRLDREIKQKNARRHNSLYGDLLEKEALDAERAKEATLVATGATEAVAVAVAADAAAKAGAEVTATVTTTTTTVTTTTTLTVAADEKKLERYPTVHANLPRFPTGIVCVVLNNGKIIDNLQDGEVTLFFKRDDTSGVVSYEVHEDSKFTKEQFEQKAKGTLDRLGYATDKALESNTWEYFPHFLPDDFVDRNNQLFALQGQWNTFYVGGLLCFENVEKCVEYSHFLVDKFF